MTHAQVSEPRGFFGWGKPGSYYCTSGKNSAKCLGQNMESSPVFIKAVVPKHFGDLTFSRFILDIYIRTWVLVSIIDQVST